MAWLRNSIRSPIGFVPQPAAIHGLRRLNCAALGETAFGQAMQSQLTKQEVIDEITRPLVEFYRPVRIYRFGSEARGESGPDSDLDFCVVLPDDAPASLYRDRSIRDVFWGLHAAIDVVRLANSDFDARAAHVVASLPATLVREGRLLYDAGRVAA